MNNYLTNCASIIIESVHSNSGNKPNTNTNTNAQLQFKFPFQTLCDFFERCERSKKHAKKKALIQKLFFLWKESEGDFFSLIRLLLPQLDKERQIYGLKESMLAKYYVEILNISPSSPDALRLLQWRKPTKTPTGALVSFPNICFTSLRCFTSLK
jgi:DNA ligase-4